MTLNTITPICCVLGHVDVGKTKFLDYLRNTHTKEASGITQQIGTTYFNSETLSKLCTSLAKNLTISGMIMIDTPGHECFTTMRYVGAIISHLVIIVVDVVKGLENETLNCLKFVKEHNGMNFVIVLNKLDKIYGWIPMKNSTLKASLDKNKKNMPRLKDYTNKIIADLACQEINACLYYENKDPKSFVSMVPISAETGEGIPDLIVLISKMMEKSTKKIMSEPISKYSFGYFLDNRYEDNIGYFNVSINVNGTIKHNDDIIIIDRNKNITEKNVKGIIISNEGKEMKDKSRYNPVTEINGTQGIGIIVDDKEFVSEPSSIYAVVTDMTEQQRNDTIALLMATIKNTNTLMCEYTKKDVGVMLNAPSINILSGLVKSFNDEKINICDHSVGKITKEMIIKTSNMYNRFGKDEYKYDYIKKYAVILSFDPVLNHSDDDIDPMLMKMCKESDVKIFYGKTVFELLKKYDQYRTTLMDKFYQKHKNIGNIFKLQILPQYIFLKTTPLMFGVKVTSGEVRIGSIVYATKDDKNVILGTIIGMQKNKSNVDIGKVNDELCIRIDNEQKITFGEDFDATYVLKKYLTQQDIEIRGFISEIEDN